MITRLDIDIVSSVSSQLIGFVGVMLLFGWVGLCRIEDEISHLFGFWMFYKRVD